MSKLILLMLIITGCVTVPHEFNKGDCALFDISTIEPGQSSDQTPILVTKVNIDKKFANRSYYDGFIRWEGKVKGIPTVMESELTMNIPRFDKHFEKTDCPPYYQCLSVCKDPTVMCVAVCKP